VNRLGGIDLKTEAHINTKTQCMQHECNNQLYKA
jgi:hypothetical protein